MLPHYSAVHKKDHDELPQVPMPFSNVLYLVVMLVAIIFVCMFTSFGRGHFTEPVLNRLLDGHAPRGINSPVFPSHCFSSSSFDGGRDIDALFKKYGSDRGSRALTGTPSAKKFHKLYGALFTARQRHMAEMVVEVGNTGAGLRTWRQYFQRALVLGIYSQPGHEIKGESRIITVPCNAASRRHKPKEYWEPFVGNKVADIVIDNSQEVPLEQAQIFHNTYESLQDGGIYIVEEFRKKPNCIRGCHHFCNLVVTRPFDNEGLSGSRTEHRLGDALHTADVFFATMESGVTSNNNMVLMKNWPNYVKPFHGMMHNYQMVYNAFLSSVPIRNIMSYRPLTGQLLSEAACSGGTGIDVFIISARSGHDVFPNVLREFARSKPGSYLFVEETSFSFCQGAPDPSSGYWGKGIQDAVAYNPDWFYVMTEDDSVLAGKMLVVRKA